MAVHWLTESKESNTIVVEGVTIGSASTVTGAATGAGGLDGGVTGVWATSRTAKTLIITATT
ncbi:MAG TPA: hypothetical protein VGL17_06965, partial [Gemmatimonadaceae bacterium]